MSDLYLIHHGVKGQKWGVRRYQNNDGTLNRRGKKLIKKYSPGRHKLFNFGLKPKGKKYNDYLELTQSIKQQNSNTISSRLDAARKQNPNLTTNSMLRSKKGKELTNQYILENGDMEVKEMDPTYIRYVEDNYLKSLGF